MIRSNSIFKMMLATAMAFFANMANASILKYEISQSGWDYGGQVQGQFSGEDLNNDGHLTLWNGEIYSYEISLTGNGHIGDFTHTLANLGFFDYTIGSAGFRPSYPLYSYDDDIGYDADDYYIGRTDFSLFISTIQDATVTQVPSPSTLSLMSALGLIALFKAKQKTRQRGN